MKIRSIISIVSITLVVFLFISVNKFNLDDLKDYLRNEFNGVFHVIKTLIITKDQDYSFIADSLDLRDFELILSKRDVNHFLDLHKKLENDEDGLEYYAAQNVWRKAKLIYNNKEYRIKIKSHGRNPTYHRNGFHISYSIKLRDGEQISNQKRFSLIVMNHIQPSKFITYHVGDDFNVLSKKEELVRVKINNWEDKLYYFDSRMDNEYMEGIGSASYKRYGYSIGQKFSTRKSFLTDSLQFDKTIFDNHFNDTFGETELSDEFKSHYYNLFYKINSSLVNNDVENVVSFFDSDYITSFLAANSILGQKEHFAHRQNFYIFYNLADGNLYPAFTRDSHLNRIRHIEDSAIEKQLTENYMPLFNVLNQNNDIRLKKYKKIYKYAVDNIKSNDNYSSIREFYNSLSYFGQMKNILSDIGVIDEDVIKNNLSSWQTSLETSSVSVSYNIFDNRIIIKVNPTSASGVKIDNLGCLTGISKINIYKKENSFLKVVHQTGNDSCLSINNYDYTMMQDIDIGLDYVDTSYYVELFLDKSLASVSNILSQLNLTNAVTNESIAYNSIFDKSIALEDYNIVDKQEDKFISILNSSGIDYTINNEELIINKGVYYLYNNLILPKNYKLIINSGVNLFLAENISIVSYNGIDIKGNKEDKVLISSIEEGKPFGVIGVLGGENSQSYVANLDLSNGSHGWVDNIFFSGALSIHYVDRVEIINSVISDNRSDDGLNIKYSANVLLRGNVFEGNFSDQVDLDYCEAVVSDSKFNYYSDVIDQNGDGLDVSGSIVVINNNQFSNFLDKGLSVGEESSVLIYENNFLNNNSAITVKDLSKAYILKNKFNDNIYDVSAYKKKRIFGGGLIYLKSKKLKLKKDEWSEFLDIGTNETQSIEDTFYHLKIDRP